jgi:hypothetical protein
MVKGYKDLKVEKVEVSFRNINQSIFNQLDFC